LSGGSFVRLPNQTCTALQRETYGSLLPRYQNESKGRTVH